MEEITFYSEGVACKGDLFIPDGCDANNPRPAIVVGHGFSGVKEVLQFHGQYLCDAGYVTLTIDYRTFGRSDGEPRGRIIVVWEIALGLLEKRHGLFRFAQLEVGAQPV